MRNLGSGFIVLLAATVFQACGSGREETAGDAGFAAIDGDRIAAADREAGNWMSHGRTYDEQRFSPLSQIDVANIGDLGLAWTYDTEGVRGHEATPIVVDDTLFLTASWSVVHALDARSGLKRWTYDPQVNRSIGRLACCDVVNRGVAVWRGKVYVAALDGRLIALDAESGEVIWSTQTTDPARPYTITAAPRVVKGKVIIGNGGAEYGVRGYFGAYDADTGELVWRFWTVPGNPADGFESPEMELAAATWNGEWWKVGGGGTVWDSMAYDPELDLLYVGTGNGSPWSRSHRSPGGGDNLFLSSILAVRPDNGELVWHYQTTPGDNWDYTATQHIVLADLEIEGESRKVLMQAPKNGFFYVLDRETGELLSAEKYVTANWASHVDLQTGRPVETGEADYDEEARLVLPSASGGHNWHPMSFNPETGLVYIPAIELSLIYAPDPAFRYNTSTWNVGVDFTAIPRLVEEFPALVPAGYLKAWDPVAQREVWSAPRPGAFNGGVLSTAGNLVFQGTSDGRFLAYAADSGEEVWSQDIGIGIVAPPISYSLGSVQYVAVLAGWGGNVIAGMDAGVSAATTHENPGRLYVFRLGGDLALPEVARKRTTLNPPEQTASPEVVQQGEVIYHQLCAVCHGLLAVSSGAVADLRMTSKSVHDNWQAIVVEGALADQGMAAFDDILDADAAEAVRAYLVQRAIEDRAAAEALDE